MVSMATILMESRDMVKTPFVFIVKYEGAGVKIAAARNIFAARSFFCLCLRYNETQGSYRNRENNTALPQGQDFSLCRSFAVCWCL